MASVFDGDYRLCCKFEVLLNLNIVLGAQVVFFFCIIVLVGWSTFQVVLHGTRTGFRAVI